MQATENYPTKKVILSYSLLGGIVGGLLFCAGMGTFILAEQIVFHSLDTSLKGIINALIGIIIIMLISWLVGMIPAFLTGLILAKTRTHWQIIKPFCIGAMLSFIFTFIIFVVFYNSDFDLKRLVASIKDSGIFALIGGLSALIVGKFVLPKEKIHASN